MAERYFVNMTEKTAPEDTNIIAIEDAVDTKKMTWANLFKPIKDLIGNLASLTTSHKSTLVGAINEVQANSSLSYSTADTTSPTLSILPGFYAAVPSGCHTVELKRGGVTLGALVSKATATYGVVIIFAYALSSVEKYTLYNGTWSGPVNL